MIRNPKQKKVKIEPRIKLNYNNYIVLYILLFFNSVTLNFYFADGLGFLLSLL